MKPEAVERYQRKARAVVDAWRGLFGVLPSTRAVVRAMCVAEFETHLGDARGSWAGEHNWGALHKRQLTSAEIATLDAHGVSPDGGEAALATARALLPPRAMDEALHIDTGPTRGHYFVWFWAFASDAEAARKFLQVLIAQRPAVRAVLELDDITEMARAMYATNYYEGVHANDPEANIHDYATQLASFERVISAALAAPAILPAMASATPVGPTRPAPRSVPSSSASPPLVASAPSSPTTWPAVAMHPRSSLTYGSRSGAAGVVLLLTAGIVLAGAILDHGAVRR